MNDQGPLGNDDLLLLRAPKLFDPQELIRTLEPLGFEAFLSTRSAIAKDELKQLVEEKGISHVYRTVLFQESVLPPGPEIRPALLTVLDGMITRLNPRSEFAIVDSYLLPKQPPADYLEELLSLLEPIACGVTKLVLINSAKKHNDQLLQDLKTSLAVSRPRCQLIHRTSNRYHDRFWIADQERALIVGTSLNGIGKHYAIADYMDLTDVIDVVADLKANGLL